jgi:folate-dependent tRNA-U54 methylase TrmFO/GidA
MPTLNVTGLAWDLSNPQKPVALFDMDAIRDIPMDWNDWLDDIESTYATHEIICAEGLQCTASSEALGVITATIQADPAIAIKVGAKLGVTWRVTAANGERDDRTVYLKMAIR